MYPRMVSVFQVRRRTLQELLTKWNRATAPGVLRTDHEHARCCVVARLVDAELRARFPGAWCELESGRRVAARWL